MVVNVLGPEETSRYFVAFQVVTLLNALVYVVGHSMYAAASRAPEDAVALVRRGGVTTLAGCVVGVLALLALAPLLLAVFGAEYAEQGTTTLRLLALGSLGVGLNYWSAMRLRIASHLRAMVGVQLLTTVLMVLLAVVLAPRGIEWVAVSWGVGQLVGGLLGSGVLAVLARRGGGGATGTPAATGAPGAPGGAA